MDFIQIMDWWTNLPQEQKERCYSYMNGKNVPQTSFDKLKVLWDKWNSWLEVTPLKLHKSFEFWLIETNENFYDCTFIKEVHLILCNECGFATTAEVKHALQQLKNID